jgi:hypothetical protein
MKFIHKVRDHRKNAKFDKGHYHIFRSEVMPVFTFTESGAIHVLWLHSYILFKIKTLVYLLLLLQCSW